MKLNDLIQEHSYWVTSVGWDHATPLELLAMIASELGEVAKCLLDHKEFSNLGPELADVLLRMSYLGLQTSIDFTADGYNVAGTPSPNADTFKDFASLMDLYGGLVNKVRVFGTDQHTPPEYEKSFQTLFVAVMAFARKFRINPEIAMEQKINLNKQRGTRGRTI